jgi:NAD(P)-dependent dehydrogenase (short-subunit alcohol dehydrogenase family)
MIAIDLDGKHAVVTGGSSGIGAACVQTLARAGATVTVLARKKGHSPADEAMYANPGCGALQASRRPEALPSCVRSPDG